MLKKEEYTKTVRRPYPPLLGAIILNGLREKRHYENIVDTPFAIKDILNSDKVWYYTKAEKKVGGELFLEAIKNSEKFKHIVEEFLKREKNLLKSTEKDLPTYIEAMGEYVPSLVFIWAVEKPLEKEIREVLKNKTSPEEIDELMDELNIPIQDNYYKQEEYYLVSTNDIEEHVKKYEWLNSRYGSKNPYTLEEAKEKLKHLNKEKYLEGYKEEKLKLKETISKAKDLLEENSHLIDALQYIIYYRTRRTDIINRSFYLAIPIFDKLASSLNLNYKQLMHCTLEEISNDKIPSLNLIDQRISDFSCMMEDSVIRILVGEDCNKIRELLKENLSGITERKGQIACKGLVKGRAKIVMDNEDFHKLQEGDILITPMTTPNFLPIMKKASAFVTDEGGITCHAAIISREMNKPCVIGTKNATDVFKDSDLVEVDANNGIVKIIKKEK